METRASETSIELDQARQQKARHYARARRRLMLVDLVLGALYLTAWITSGAHLLLRDRVGAFSSLPAFQVLLYALALGIPYVVIDLPLSYYSGFVLPHRYGQSTQSFGHWAGDQIKGLAIGGVLGAAVLSTIYWLLRVQPDWWWLYAGGVMFVFSVVLSNLAPVLLAPLFYKFSPLDDADLKGRLLALAERANTQVQGVFRFDMSTRTRGANAALMGLGRTRRIVLGDTLLEEFTPDEIEVILAHELAHHVHRDIPLLIAFEAILTLLSFGLAHLALRLGVTQFGLQGVSDPAGMPVLAVGIGLIGLLTMPLGNALSRWREREADRYAIRETRKPQAFIDAMTRLANQNLADAEPERWVVVLLHSHPPISDRIRDALRFTEVMSGRTIP